jgi:hypothetical protein
VGGASAQRAAIAETNPGAPQSPTGSPTGPSGGGEGGTQVIYVQSNYPPTPAMLRAVADDATSGIGLQPSRNVSTERLGL